MLGTPCEEPCGCAWGSADLPFERDEHNLSQPDADYEHDAGLKQFTECLECGAVWTTRQDNAWVRAAERAAARR